MSKQLVSWIDGASYSVSDASDTELVSPWDGSAVFRLQSGGDAAINLAVENARHAFRSNLSASALDRREWLLAGADEVTKAIPAIAQAAVAAIGKPVKAANFEANRTAQFMRHCAEEIGHVHGEVLPLDITRPGTGRMGFTRRVPYGVIGAVTPFNAPANLLMQKVAPAIAMGNSVVVKPSFEGAEVALILADCFTKAGVPNGLFNVVTGRREEALSLARHKDVAILTLTGGNAAADAIGTAAGAKPLYSELGGNSANIVLADAGLEDAASRIAASAFEASGQQCISAQRIIVEKTVFDAFLDHFVKAAKALKVGDPGDPSTDVGPMINIDAAKRVAAMVDEAVANDAELVLGGGRKDALVEPTILVNPHREAQVVRQEVFGPVAAVIAVDDVDHAIATANDCEFGLQASCFTLNLEHAMRVSDEIESGSLWINEASRFRLDLYPFGGMGKSGFGREGVRYAMEEYSQWKFTGFRMPSRG